MVAADIEAALEKVLRGIPDGETWNTTRVVTEIGMDPADSYRIVLKLAPVIPCASKGGRPSKSFGRTVYPWLWRRLRPDQSLVSAGLKALQPHQFGERPPEQRLLTYQDMVGMEERLTALIKVVALSGAQDLLVPATKTPLVFTLEECLACGETKLCNESICQDCGDHDDV